MLFREISVQGKLYFSYGRTLNYIYACTLKQYYILEVNNLLVNLYRTVELGYNVMKGTEYFVSL
jgi:hypothetical protein